MRKKEPSPPGDFVVFSTLKEGLAIEPDYLIEGLLEQGEQALLYGQPKVGKTFLAIQLAVSVASGKQFLSWKVPRARKVLYINFEMGHRVFAERVAGMLVQPSESLPKSKVSDFYEEQLGGRLLFSVAPRSFDVENFSSHLRDFIASREPDLVIFDTLAKLHSVDERANELIGRVLTRVRDACERQNCVAAQLIVHHARKASVAMDDRSSYLTASEIRGGSAIRGEADVIIGLARSPGGAGGGARHQLILEARNVPLKDVDIEFDDKSKRFKLAPVQKPEKAVDLLKRYIEEATGPIPKTAITRRIAKKLDVVERQVRGQIRGWIKDQVRAGHLREKNKVKGYDGKIVFLIKTGKRKGEAKA